MELGGSVREPELMVHCIPSFGSQQVNQEMSDFPSQHQCLELPRVFDTVSWMTGASHLQKATHIIQKGSLLQTRPNLE